MSAFLFWSTGSHALAQDQKQTSTAPSQSPIETERPKTEENAIEGDVETGRALALPKPAYPRIARAAHVSGQVTVQLLIDVDGTVMEAVAVSGHPLLQGVSVQAAKDSRFSPTKVDGKAVKVTGIIRYDFISQ